jgi:4'-phosphopantetheinyl transferase
MWTSSTRKAFDVDLADVRIRERGACFTMTIMPATGSGQQTSWSQASLMPAFPTSRVDVWRVRLDEPTKEEPVKDEPAKAGSDANLLSPDEIARASQFHFEQDRIHFTRCRSALRFLLAAYLKIPPDKIRFEYLAGGKPYLAAEQNSRALRFNVSHSAGMALIAVGSEHQLGIDIEKIRGDVDVTALAERFFSPRERAGLRALPAPLRVAGFYACWTRKESFLKATGTGLSFPLTDFSVTTHPDLDPELEEINGNTEAGKQWSLADLSGIDGYRATVASEHSYSRLDTYAWN